MDDPVAWATGVLGTAEITPLRQRPWSSTWRVESPWGAGILKATGPGSRYEAVLLRELAAVRPQQIPELWAVHEEQGWLLMADAGPTLRARLQNWDQAAWERLLPQYAQLQRAVAPLAKSLVQQRVPDERPRNLGNTAGQLLDQAPELAVLTGAERARLRTMATSVRRLTELEIPASVHHGDLHENNVSPAGDGFVFFDFGDASVSHPFMSMFVPLEKAAQAAIGTTATGRLSDAYLDGYTDLASRDQLRRTLDAALALGWLTRATTWHRALKSVTGQHEWGEPILAYARSALAATERAAAPITD